MNYPVIFPYCSTISPLISGIFMGIFFILAWHNCAQAFSPVLYYGVLALASGGMLYVLWTMWVIGVIMRKRSVIITGTHIECINGIIKPKKLSIPLTDIKEMALFKYGPNYVLEIFSQEESMRINSAVVPLEKLEEIVETIQYINNSTE